MASQSAGNSWANILGSRLRKSERKNKNVLEIGIESERNSENFCSEMVEELFKKLEIRMTDVETV